MPLSRRRFVETGALVALGTVLAGCQGGDGNGGDGDSGDGGDGDSGDGSSDPVETVEMVGSQFEPRNLEVDAGTTVTWVNQDSAAHTVTDASDNWSFDEQIDGGEEASFSFEDSGVYDVYCKFHGSADLSGMSMKIGVGGATIRSPLGGGSGGSDGNDGGGGGAY